MEFKDCHLFLSITREERGHHRAGDQRRPPGLHVKPSPPQPTDPHKPPPPPTPWCEGPVPGSVVGLSETSDEVNRARWRFSYQYYISPLSYSQSFWSDTKVCCKYLSSHVLFSKTLRCRHFKHLSVFNVEPLIFFFKTLILTSSREKWSLCILVLLSSALSLSLWYEKILKGEVVKRRMCIKSSAECAYWWHFCCLAILTWCLSSWVYFFCSHEDSFYKAHRRRLHSKRQTT